MKNLRQQLINDAENLRNAFRRLSDHWTENPDEYDELLEDGYPFQLSFDELAIEVSEWIETIKENSEKIQNHNQIESMYTQNTGGNCMVDYFILGDTTIGLTDEVVVLYNVSDPEKIEDERNEIDHVFIDQYGEEIGDYWELKDEHFAPHFFKRVHNVSDDGIIRYDIIEMKNGISIAIDDGSINVYPTLKDAKDDRNLIGTITR